MRPEKKKKKHHKTRTAQALQRENVSDREVVFSFSLLPLSPPFLVHTHPTFPLFVGCHHHPSPVYLARKKGGKGESRGKRSESMKKPLTDLLLLFESCGLIITPLLTAHFLP